MKSTKNTSSAQGPEKRPPEEFDLILGGASGTGGSIAAWTFASQGQRVAVIERKYVGGSCPNIACLPSKNIIHSAKVASYLRRSEEFGIARERLAVYRAARRDSHSPGLIPLFSSVPALRPALNKEAAPANIATS